LDCRIPSGWGAAAAVGFSIAGRLSDIFGRRYVILFGQSLTIIGGIVACTAKTMNALIAGEVILGASIGTISVAYAGKLGWLLYLQTEKSSNSSRLVRNSPQ
jgi:MFS family permease